MFPEEVLSRLPPDRGIGHETDLDTDTKYCVTRQWPLPKEQVDYTDEFFDKRSKGDMCVRANRLTAARPFVCVNPQVVGAWFMLIIS